MLSNAASTASSATPSITVTSPISRISTNRSDRPRRATVINAFRDGTRSDSDESPLAGVPPVPKGQPMRGQFFPLLFDS